MLYISDIHKAIYIHNPKVAGTYIHSILTKFYQFEKIDIKKSNEEHAIFTENNNLDKIDDILKVCQSRRKGITRYVEDIINDTKYKDYFKFTFVRNPYTKIISAWNYSTNFSITNKQIFKDSEEHHIDEYDFDEFIRQGMHTCTDYTYFHSFITQTDHLINSENKIDFAFIGKFENLIEDFQTILKKLNINDFIHIGNESDIPLNYSIKTKPNYYYLTKENIAVISKYFEKDFINFDYAIRE